MSDLDRLLEAGSRHVQDDVTYVVEPHPAGSLVLPTGQLAAFDPGVTDEDEEPFTVPVTPGTHPVTAWVAILEKEGREWQRRVAALQVTVRPGVVMSWELALVASDEPADLAPGEFFGYGVETGAGGFADLSVSRILAGWDTEEFEETFDPDEFPEEPIPGHFDHVIDPDTGANLIMAESGWGDGFYPTYVGRTADGEVACFVTDFLVVP
ncbi:hypothetical protein ACWT_2504 [Actinoplanes sp. SE50]|uniref:DUF4241 domain-containing protein n=1 Tax=unclassified Actinoplanes TaxID=2626549 RepID=UPI00023ED5CC|nr:MULTISPECIES: DUF4241 domain-containing protein [unclassified Actinoplanes]AEV83937.1 hypothetical protein ACPL_3042 [Actinoplanes sp. SE50/110]ATO81919.1 hypothetical protein ACWT_2504 [Actinoplanes sp. SE50]SLL99327.1 hypothetical protein ACSP50_2558 [Actinoplanes sp. SE50/110]